MHRIDSVFEAQFDDRWDIEVGADRLAWFANGVGFVGFEAMQGESVFVRVDRYGTDPEFVSAAEDTDGDFAAPVRTSVPAAWTQRLTYPLEAKAASASE